MLIPYQGLITWEKFIAIYFKCSLEIISTQMKSQQFAEISLSIAAIDKAVGMNTNMNYVLTSRKASVTRGLNVRGIFIFIVGESMLFASCAMTTCMDSVRTALIVKWSM